MTLGELIIKLERERKDRRKSAGQNTRNEPDEANYDYAYSDALSAVIFQLKQVDSLQ